MRVRFRVRDSEVERVRQGVAGEGKVVEPGKSVGVRARADFGVCGGERSESEISMRWGWGRVGWGGRGREVTDDHITSVAGEQLRRLLLSDRVPQARSVGAHGVVEAVVACDSRELVGGVASRVAQCKAPSAVQRVRRRYRRLDLVRLRPENQRLCSRG